MLDRTKELEQQDKVANRAAVETLGLPKKQGVIRKLRGYWQYFVGQGSSSLTRRIVFLNVAGLFALFVGILYLSQSRAFFIEARIRSLQVQAEIIAGAIAASATVETDSITIDPDRLLELQLGETYGPDDSSSALEFPINPERVAPVLRRLISPTNTRARIYDRDGVLLLDSRNLYGRGDVLRFDLPSAVEKPGFFEKQLNSIRKWFAKGDLPVYQELGPENGKGYPEVASALNGNTTSIVRINQRGEVIISVATPVQRFRAIRGVLLLSTQGADIEQSVAAERLAIFKVFLVAAVTMTVLSMLLARTIAGPVRRLADAAERVRRRVRTRVEIPDFTNRRDEIGDLSGALREMTNVLYSRIEAIESFAADVAHELKNPLTSLRSAVETIPLAKTRESQERLMAVIQHDVRRLDRLISDISDASRLDAELQRHESAPVNLYTLLTTVVSVANQVKQEDDIQVRLSFEGGGPNAFIVSGHDSRIGQVIDNLIANARSFSSPGGSVRVTARRVKNFVEIIVDDDGPGIRPDAFEKIFERFYTDRPHQGFGNNSGLGLSISKQIIEAHGGKIWAENRQGVPTHDGADPLILGARFTVRLPAV
ncbi:stimulus-sensing domain-containing protein [Pseudorhodoplanes sinuspersici]|uniref:histidine kinase n=1 Tax=Pseudorhodoplanes sinuspersici TaxID=1235591 RepID=A0A1W6ZN87_9HYPH|nr:histidine kinase [Pseudorhodoplanes sinuspersici]RKE69562.1 two-component system sensor histidine kinase ChvG [Pseudorhodoplanes sinuspersici]